MSFIGRSLAATTVTAFTPMTYDAAFPDVHMAHRVTPEGAMGIPAVYACTTVISEDIAKIPLQIFKFLDDGKAVAKQHPIYELLHDQPNKYQTALEFREMMTAFALNRDIGGKAEIIPGPRGPVDQLIPLNPDLLTREITQSGAVRYKYQDPLTHQQRIILAESMFSLNGRFGRSVLGYAAESFSLQLAMQQYAAQAYKRGPRHTGVIQRPKDAPKWTDTARANFRVGVDEYMGEGERAGRPMLLEDGMTWQSAGITMRDAEFVATMQHGVADVCRFYRVPQHKVQELLRSTNNNIEQQSLDYVVDSLMAWAVRWEQAIRRDLIVNPAMFFAQHNLDGLMRADTKSRNEAYAIAIQWGWMTRAEARQKDNQNPIDGLDEPLVPLNMRTINEPVPSPTPPPVDQGPTPTNGAVVGHLRALVRDGAARIVRKEHAELARLAERTGGSGDKWRAGVRAFYLPEHADYVARVLRVPDEHAERYAEGRAAKLMEEGPAALNEFDADTIDSLAEMALRWADVLKLPEAA